MDRQIQAHCKRQYRNLQNLYHDCNKCTTENKRPGQFTAHNSFHHHLHQSRLRRRKFLRTIPPGSTQQIQHAADGNGGYNHTNQFARLLFHRRCTYDEAGFQILGCIPGNGCDNTDDGSNGNGSNHTGHTDITAGFQQHGRYQQCGNGHTGYRVIGTAYDTYHSGRNGSKEKSEYNNDNGADQIHRNRRNQPHCNGNHTHNDHNNVHGQIFAQTVVHIRLLAVYCHGLFKRTDNHGERFNQGKNTACSHCACTDITDKATPDTPCTQLTHRSRGRIQYHISAKQHNQRHQYKPANRTTGQQVRRYLGTTDIPYAGQGRKHIHTDAGTFVTLNFKIHFTGEQLEAVCNKLIHSRNSQSCKNRTGLCTAFFSGKKHFRACLSFRIGKFSVLLHNQSGTQRNHKQYAQHTAAESDEGNLKQRRIGTAGLRCPHKQRRHRKNRTGGH